MLLTPHIFPENNFAHLTKTRSLGDLESMHVTLMVVS